MALVSIWNVEKLAENKDISVKIDYIDMIVYFYEKYENNFEKLVFNDEKQFSDYFEQLRKHKVPLKFTR